eukprot:TRINITY_DN4006_c0_g1_i1.p1 TRINITY_DN4006_c0_g1~~TRINITY_DN4006_c0_g1_i1.p1  ORF type:complete len:1112 (-),score=370.22 TRINITY_DN4006_c0_g1_i1:73-2940(-)
MKPPEILGMIEEAAGTKLYEDKKTTALQTMDKKERKVEEINTLLQEKITPQLESLKDQQKQYNEWLDAKRDIEKLQRLRIAYQYAQAMNAVSNNDEEQTFIQKIEELTEEKENQTKTLEKLKKKIQSLTEKKEKHISAELTKLEAEVDTLSKKLVRQRASFKNMEDVRGKDKSKVQEYQKTKENIIEKIKKTRATLEKEEQELESLKKKRQEKKDQVENLKRQLQAISAGVAAGADGSSGTLNDRLMEAKREVSACNTEVRSCTVRISHLEQELVENKKKLSKKDNDYKKLKDEESALNEELRRVQQEINSTGFNPDEFDKLIERKRNLVHEVRTLQDILSRSRPPQAQFYFDDPDPNIKKQILGRLSTVVTVKSKEYTTCLEVAAGARIHNVVVATEEVSKHILNSGKLNRRETFIPLNKISAKVLKPEQVEKSYQEVGRENVATATSLLSFDTAAIPAVNYVFGSTLITQSTDQAKKVTFTKSIAAKSVTVAGDMFDPAGTITGGSAPKDGDVLRKMFEYKQKEQELNNKELELKAVENSLNKMMGMKSKYFELKNQYETKERQMKILQERISQTDYFQFQKKVDDATHELESLSNRQEEYKKKGEDASELVKEIENQLENFDQESQLNLIKKAIDKANKELENISEKLKTMSADHVRRKSDIEEMEKESDELTIQIDKIHEELSQNDGEVNEKEKTLGELERQYEEKKYILDARKTEFISADTTISNYIAQRDSISKSISDAEISIKKYEHKITSFKSGREKATKTIDSLKKANPWIEKEEQFFGKEKSDYDFDANPIHQVHENLKNLEEKYDQLSKQINKKAVAMFESAQQEYRELISKKKQIEADKTQIQNFIDELDKKKNDTLEKTFKKVNEDFGKIFSQLLPGTQAKLEPMEGHSFLDGLQVRVAFGKVWNDSLSGLSGGQKSLLALSLVLALLLFSPAPMYILGKLH